MIQPSGYTNNIGIRTKTVNTASAVPVNKEIVSSKPVFKGNNSAEREHISYWRSLGISSVFGLSAAGFATIFAQKWRTAAICGRERPTKKPDTDNIFKLVTDALSGVIYADDKQIVSCRVQKWYSEEPRTEVRIAIVTDEVIKND